MLLKKLVIAEDDDAIAHLVAATLGDAGFLCLRARDGEEAVNLVRSEQPDALLLDVMMPKMDGMQVCEQLKSDVLLSRIPILLLTSLADIEHRVKGLDAGADDYLSKPFDHRELTARVKALIRASRRERDRNPTTNLPSGEAIEEYVAKRLKTDEKFVVLYLDIENFRSFADTYGYQRAEEIVAFTGNLILNDCRAEAEEAPVPFVGHIGGDDFIIICDDAEVAVRLQSEIEESFKDCIDQLYSAEDLERGFLLMTLDGEERRAEFMRPSIAIVHVRPSQYDSTQDLARDITRAKAQVRRRTGSSVFHLPQGG